MDKLQQLVGEFWGILAEMAPYLLFGFIIAGFLSVFISPKLVERNLGGHGIWPIIKASLFGVPLPICSCGVLPVAASLRNHGASPSATTSFLLSTPQTGIDSILVTYSLLGPIIAIFRPVAAFVTGIIGGGLVEVSTRNDLGNESMPQKCEAECCNTQSGQNKLVKALHYGLVTLPEDIGRAILIGLVIAAAVSLALPDDFFAGKLGDGIWTMLVMLVAGIPVYVCATASVPLAAALMTKGISAGAALVFLIAGPATNAAAIAMIWKILGRKTALIYLATVAGGALVAGLLLDYIFTIEGISVSEHLHKGGQSYVENISAIILIIVLGNALISPYFKKKDDEITETGMAITILQIKGMTCSHCVANVTRALQEVEGVNSVSVNLKTGETKVNGAGFTVDDLEQAVVKAGYKVIN
ncbi:heavy metal-associated domain-containing protein [candidate division LCP-89 bacterium B3_LCP]|uniref:Heavy metal-associated domain-containing protein n=1 Tax=candidate division LCP-89 bacterium B3_LCP TaxID=2012998 RepID=A0A532V4P3_UNCL8|nr:MAG: heavy metal-associated domain-containing protein [candidate division LCP-89 bacterium B3_LCP]